MKTKFTKGSWKITTHPAFVGELRICGDGEEIAIVRSIITNKEANAKLIAAAPEMLEVLKVAKAALELCRQHMRDNSNLNLWYGLSAPKRIEEVIKKATE